MDLLDRILTVAGELFLHLGFDRGLGAVGRTEGRGGTGWIRVYDGPDDEARRLAGRILREHLPCGLHRTGPGRSEVVVRTMHAEQAFALVDALGLDDQR
jgi:hypothetical protein